MFVILMAVLGLLLTSCAGTAEMDITVYSGNRYRQEIVIGFPADMLQLAGGSAEIEQLLDEMVAEAQADGVNLSWRQIRSRDSNLVQYEIRSGMTRMTDADTQGFSWTEATHNNRRAYEFKFFDYIGSEFQNFTLTLHAGKILDTNGTQLDSRTVQWVNPTGTPYAVVQPKSTVKWIPLVGAILLLLATVGIVALLLLTGRLKTWGAAGFSSGKWWVQAMKLNNERTRVEKDKGKLISELGKKAWAARVAHPSYSELYERLEALEQQRAVLSETAQAIELQLQQVRQTRTQTESEYKARINEVQDERKAVSTRLNQVRTDKAAQERRASKVQADQQKAQAEIQSLQNRLAQVQASAAPDRETQAASLSNAIAALEQSLAQLVNEMPHLQSEIARLTAEEQPLVNEVNRLEQQLAQMQGEQREALAPLDQQIAGLQNELRTHTEQAAALTQQMPPLIEALGPQVEHARPESAALAEMYDQLDKTSQELTQLSQQHDLMKARLGASDTGAVRNFYLVIGALGLALILIVILLIIALI